MQLVYLRTRYSQRRQYARHTLGERVLSAHEYNMLVPLRDEHCGVTIVASAARVPAIEDNSTALCGVMRAIWNFIV